MTPTLLAYIQIALSVVLIGLVLIQYSDAGAGSAFGGGDNWNSAFHTRRGAEKFFFFATIFVAVAFTASTVVALLIK
ncbi:MAG: preprotein translocase subunit SecG [Patescibacteria group bacterium]|jgi:protein translocase SecG subunit|nr:preprotein translocase subunit SecG [Patescibacteria group bacterium]